MDLPEAIAVVLLALAASCIQALSGFGFSLFFVPLVAFVTGPKEAVVLSSLLGTAHNAGQALHLRHSAEWRLVSRLLGGAVFGMPIGLVTLLAVDSRLLQALIAATVLLLTLLLMRGVRLGGGGLASDLATGFIGGVLSTSVSMSGPPVVLYLQGRRMPPRAFRATTTAFFVAGGSLGLVFLAAGGAIELDLLLLAAIGLPSVVVGRLLGNALFDRFEERLFQRLVYAVLLLTATAALVSAAVG